MPINNKNFLTSKIPYFKNLLKDDNLFGNKSHVEIDGEKCLIIRDQDPKIFASILKMLYTEKLEVTLDNCIEIYRILDFLNLCQDTGSVGEYTDEDAGQIILGPFLADDVYNFIERNLTKLSKIQFDKILRYNLPLRFWESIYENLHKTDPVKFDKVNDEYSLSINAMRIDAVPGHSEKFKISKTEKLEKFMDDYCNRKVLVRNNTHFYFNGNEITRNQTPNELFMKENDQIFITSVINRNVRFVRNQRDRDEAARDLADFNEQLRRDRPGRVNYFDRYANPRRDPFYEGIHQQMLRARGLPGNRLPQPAVRNEAARNGEPRERENPNREPGVQVPRDDVARADNLEIPRIFEDNNN